MVIATVARKALRRPSRIKASVKKAPVRWKIPAGKRRAYEAVFDNLFGNPPRGTSWSLLAERYPERFRDYLEQGLEEYED